jgi:hypothetical protein
MISNCFPILAISNLLDGVLNVLLGLLRASVKPFRRLIAQKAVPVIPSMESS